MLRKWGTLVLSLLIAPMLALAQNTGKLAGQVLDASTGEPLPGANVVLAGTQLGTAADVEGNYFIIGVPVGTYDVQASFVGYQVQTQVGVEINAGYTREINFNLSPGAELDEIVVEYERPLIQKDAIGVPKIATAEEIANLPVRGVAEVAAIQAGVVKTETGGSLYIRGGREQEVTYYVDGVRVIGYNAVTTQSVQEQEMLIGSIPAKYGDAMSGIISITTKSGAPNFFGSVEAITSEALDAYGYNTASVTVGGPIMKDKLSFFASVEYTDVANSGPRATQFAALPDNVLDDLLANPQAVRIVNDATGEIGFTKFPGNLADGTHVNDVIPMLNVPEGWHLRSDTPTPLYRANSFGASDWEFQDAHPAGNPSNALQFNGNLMFAPTQSIRLRIGGGYSHNESQGFSRARSLYNPGQGTQYDRNTGRLYAAWTHYLSNSTFYQLQVDYTDYLYWNYMDGFSHDVRDGLFYGDMDHAVNIRTTRYMRYNSADSTYTRQYEDGNYPGGGDIQNTWAPPGSSPGTGYQQGHNQRLGFRANATTQIGLHQIEFGGEYEQRTNRYYSVSAGSLSRYYDDGDPEGGAENVVTRWEDLNWNRLDRSIYYYGYDFRGLSEVDDESIEKFTDTGASVPDANYNIAPYKPIYYAGYIQDKIEYKDLVLNLGLRVDVFDQNTITLFDEYSLLPIRRVGDVGGAPNNMGDDYAVYFDNTGAVVGYRDLGGSFYDANGLDARALDIRNAGSPQVKRDLEGNEIRHITDEVFKDYEPEVTFMPRIGISFPVTDQALFFASYDVVTQRPSENNFDTIQQWIQATESSKRNNNSGLMPEKTTNYELGFRQRLGARAAIQVSGFYKQVENKIQRRIIQNAFPNNYQYYQNVDFGTVKGVELEFDLRRTNNVTLNANYTLSFAQGTGSDAATVWQIIWRQETNPFYPNFISPLDFDQRHRFNLTLDYRLGENEGPEVFGGFPLSNFGFNLVGTFASGMPYTRRLDDSPIYTSFNGFLKGSINGENQPATTLLNLRIDRRFTLGGANLTAFLWIQNLLNVDNVQGVYATTGLPDDDGYLDTPLGVNAVSAITEASSPTEGQSFYDHYRLRVDNPYNFGIPRQTRLGVRLDF